MNSTSKMFKSLLGGGATLVKDQKAQQGKCMKRTSKMTKGIFTIVLGLTAVAFTSQALAQGDTWDTTKAPMPTAAIVPEAEVIDGLLYVVGGGTATVPNTFQVYDPGTDTWDTTKALPPHTTTSRNAGSSHRWQALRRGRVY